MYYALYLSFGTFHIPVSTHKGSTPPLPNRVAAKKAIRSPSYQEYAHGRVHTILCIMFFLVSDFEEYRYYKRHKVLVHKFDIFGLLQTILLGAILYANILAGQAVTEGLPTQEQIQSIITSLSGISTQLSTLSLSLAGVITPLSAILGGLTAALGGINLFVSAVVGFIRGLLFGRRRESTFENVLDEMVAGNHMIVIQGAI